MKLFKKKLKKEKFWTALMKKILGEISWDLLEFPTLDLNYTFFGSKPLIKRMRMVRFSDISSDDYKLYI